MNSQVDRKQRGYEKKRHGWPYVVTARALLRSLVYQGEPLVRSTKLINTKTLTLWLVQQGLSSMAYRRYKTAWPELANALRGDYFEIAALNSLHMQQLDHITRIFSQESIPIVLLKGAALGQMVYDDVGIRPMSDLDFWVRKEDMSTAIRLMLDAGYKLSVKEERPLELQRLANGEVSLLSPSGRLIELHWAPFSGWWINHTAEIDVSGLWARLETLGSTRSYIKELETDKVVDLSSISWRTLSAEDTILHLAWHLGVNHQFGMWPVRTLVDVVMIAQCTPINWDAVIQRAREWHLLVVLWSVLQFAEQLIGHDEFGPVLQEIRPSFMRRGLFRRLVPVEILLCGDDLTKHLVRYPILLLLTDRSDAPIRLVFRTIWPKKAWLEARYGLEQASHWRHLWRVLRYREI